jgi:tetratricopeptide (TPR) repeat protein
MQQTFLCPKCKGVAHLGQRFCGFCDLSFVYACQECGKPVEPSFTYCGGCGTKIDWVINITPAKETEPAAKIAETGTTTTETSRKNPADVHHEKSLDLLKEGHYMLAIEELTKAIHYDPDKAIVYLLRGGAYYRNGDYDLALPDFDKAIDLDPTLAAAFYNRGSIFYYKQMFDRAIKDFSKAIALDSNDPGAYHNRGCSYLMKGQYENAIDDISKSIELDPSDPRVYHSRGTAYMRQGESKLAINDFRKVVSMTTDKAIAQRAEEILRELEEASSD